MGYSQFTYTCNLIIKMITFVQEHVINNLKWKHKTSHWAIAFVSPALVDEIKHNCHPIKYNLCFPTQSFEWQQYMDQRLAHPALSLFGREKKRLPNRVH